MKKRQIYLYRTLFQNLFLLFLLISVNQVKALGTDSVLIFKGFDNVVAEDAEFEIILDGYIFDSTGLTPYVFTLLSKSQHLNLQHSGNRVKVTSAPHYHGKEWFSVLAINTANDSLVSTFQITFFPFNDTPICIGNPPDTNINLFGTARYKLSPFFRDDDNLWPPGDSLTFSVEVDTNLVEVTLKEDSLALTPRNYSGTIPVKVIVTDLDGAQAEATFQVNSISPMNFGETYPLKANGEGCRPYLVMEKSERAVIAMETRDNLLLLNNEGKLVTDPIKRHSNNGRADPNRFMDNAYYMYGGDDYANSLLTVIYKQEDAWTVWKSPLKPSIPRTDFVYFTHFHIPRRNTRTIPFVFIKDSLYQIAEWSQQTGITVSTKVRQHMGHHLRKIIKIDSLYAFFFVRYGKTAVPTFQSTISWTRCYNSSGLPMGKPYSLSLDPADTSTSQVHLVDALVINGRIECLWSKRQLKTVDPCYRTVFDKDMVPVKEAQAFPGDFRCSNLSGNAHWELKNATSYTVYINHAAPHSGLSININPATINTATDDISWDWTGEPDSQYIRFNFKDGNYLEHRFAYPGNVMGGTYPYHTSLQSSQPTIIQYSAIRTKNSIIPVMVERLEAYGIGFKLGTTVYDSRGRRIHTISGKSE